MIYYRFYSKNLFNICLFYFRFVPVNLNQLGELSIVIHNLQKIKKQKIAQNIIQKGIAHIAKKNKNSKAWFAIFFHQLKRYNIVFIMKASLKQELISQQIDVVLIGSRSFQLLQILLDQNLSLVPMPKLKNKYLNKLWSLYPGQSEPNIQLPSKFPANFPQSKIQKYTTNLLTQSFWIQFNFFYFGALAYDPLLGGITRGRIPICIYVSSQQQKDNIEIKKLLTKDSSSTTMRQISAQQTGKAINSRQELIMEQKIINSMHSFKLSQFSSVLTLKMIDKTRIIEGSSNIKLNRNQILRWIVDRHFENQFDIKLRGEVGDQIQNYHQAKEESVCTIM